jgi:hypothetical protein
VGLVVHPLEALHHRALRVPRAVTVAPIEVCRRRVVPFVWVASLWRVLVRVAAAMERRVAVVSVTGALLRVRATGALGQAEGGTAMAGRMRGGTECRARGGTRRGRRGLRVQHPAPVEQRIGVVCRNLGAHSDVARRHGVVAEERRLDVGARPLRGTEVVAARAEVADGARLRIRSRWIMLTKS